MKMRGKTRWNRCLSKVQGARCACLDRV